MWSSGGFFSIGNFDNGGLVVIKIELEYLKLFLFFLEVY